MKWSKINRGDKHWDTGIIHKLLLHGTGKYVKTVEDDIP
jgi:hypothetical protein